MKKIIIFTGTLQTGGAERVISEISSVFLDYFDMVEILMYYDSEIFYNINSKVKINSIEKQTHSVSILKNAIWMRRYVKNENPDVFLSFMVPFNIFSILSLLGLNIIIIVCDRSDPKYAPKNILYKLLRNVSYFFASKIEVQTEKNKNYFNKFLQKKIYVIPNPNHITIFERNLVMQTEKKHKIVSVGRLIESKNYKMLINVFAEICKLYPDYTLNIYGEGDKREELQLQINRLSLQNNVILHGVVKNVVEEIKDAEIFIMSSYFEGMPNALMEALALGIPCISTNVSGTEELIINGENGFIVDNNNQKQMILAIDKLLKSTKIRNKFSKNTIMIHKNFSKNKVFSLWVDLVLN